MIALDSLWLDRWPSRAQEGYQRWRVVAKLPNGHIVLQQENRMRLPAAMEPAWDTDQEARILPEDHLRAVFEPATKTGGLIFLYACRDVTCDGISVSGQGACTTCGKEDWVRRGTEA